MMCGFDVIQRPQVVLKIIRPNVLSVLWNDSILLWCVDIDIVNFDPQYFGGLSEAATGVLGSIINPDCQSGYIRFVNSYYVS